MSQIATELVCPVCGSDEVAMVFDNPPTGQKSPYIWPFSKLFDNPHFLDPQTAGELTREAGPDEIECQECEAVTEADIPLDDSWSPKTPEDD